MKIVVSRQIEERKSNNKIHYILTVVYELFREKGRTDTTKLIVAFRNFPYRNRKWKVCISISV